VREEILTSVILANEAEALLVVEKLDCPGLAHAPLEPATTATEASIEASTVAAAALTSTEALASAALALTTTEALAPATETTAAATAATGNVDCIGLALPVVPGFIVPHWIPIDQVLPVC